MKTYPAVTKAFTLVELLAVIAIVGVLSALLIAGLGNAREAGRSAACLNELRQLAAACQLYTGDNKGVLIPICTGTDVSDAQTWRVYLVPYLGKTPTSLHCPSDPVIPIYGDGRGLQPASYGINRSIGLHQYFASNPQKRANQVLNPSRKIFMSDIGYVTNPGASPSQWVAQESATAASFGYARFPNDASFSAVIHGMYFPVITERPTWSFTTAMQPAWMCKPI